MLLGYESKQLSMASNVARGLTALLTQCKSVEARKAYPSQSGIIPVCCGQQAKHSSPCQDIPVQQPVPSDSTMLTCTACTAQVAHEHAQPRWLMNMHTHAVCSSSHLQALHWHMASLQHFLHSQKQHVHDKIGAVGRYCAASGLEFNFSLARDLATTVLTLTGTTCSGQDRSETLLR